MTTMDYGASAHEQQRLEERMRDEMEHAHRHTANAKAHHHVTELGNSGIREDPFDVVLRNGDGGGEDRRNRTDPSDNLECGRLDRCAVTVSAHQRKNPR